MVHGSGGHGSDSFEGVGEGSEAGGDGEDEEQLWTALDAVWEFAFLQVGFGVGGAGEYCSKRKLPCWRVLR